MESERTKERFGLVEEREIKGRKEKIGETDRESERDERKRKREKKKERDLTERGEIETSRQKFNAKDLFGS